MLIDGAYVVKRPCGKPIVPEAEVKCGVVGTLIARLFKGGGCVAGACGVVVRRHVGHGASRPDPILREAKQGGRRVLCAAQLEQRSGHGGHGWRRWHGVAGLPDTAGHPDERLAAELLAFPVSRRLAFAAVRAGLLFKRHGTRVPGSGQGPTTDVYFCYTRTSVGEACNAGADDGVARVVV